MNHPYYEKVSERVMEILRTQSDTFEQTSIDEAFIDVSGRTGFSFDSARDTALEIKKQLLKQENVTCSIGIGPNKVVAKIASDQSKPNGLTIVKPKEVTDFLSPLPVSRIPGVGKKAEEKLTQLNVSTVSQLSRLSPTILVETFGKSVGSYFHRASRGEDDDPVKEREQPTQFSRIATLKQNTRQSDETFPLLSELAQSVSGKLREQGMTCKTVAVIAILTDLSIHSRSKMLESPSSDARLIESATKQLLQEFLRSNPEAVLRRVGVKVSSLIKESGQTNMSKFLAA
jgi:DNA polymerase IV (DinB-like DNA polymerase)